MEKIYTINSLGFDLSRAMSNEEVRSIVFLEDESEDEAVKNAFKKANASYLHWEELRYKNWLPTQYKKENFWYALRAQRALKSKKTSIKDASGALYVMNTENYHEFLHIVDKEMAGTFMGIPALGSQEKQQYITQNIVEESIASSRLEGANTSREVARRMLHEGRTPRTYGEKMIVNNHRAMQTIEASLHTHEMSLELLFDLHRMITKDTLSQDKQGKLRETFDEKGNRLVIKPWDDATITYTTPDREFVEQELPRLIKFANNKSNESGFIHPLIKGIMLHFWIGLLHPFEDGNGRLARLLFYWYMLRQGYWAFAYLSLSEKIVKSPRQYSMSYIYSEQDGFDLTYFIHYNLEKLDLAHRDFTRYLGERIKESKGMLARVQRETSLNERQIRLLRYLHQQKDMRTTLAAYKGMNAITKMTAATDLADLVKQNFLEKHKHGRNVFYYPTKKVEALFPMQ